MVPGMTRLTVAQALVRFLAAQETERDGRRERLIAGCYGIFGHGNVAGLGQALHQYRDLLPYHPARNEQGMVHIAAGYARQRNRLGTFACTTSVGPGATNMVTGAALATINRLPGAAAARRHVRHPHAASRCSSMLEVPHDADGVGQRLLPSGVALLRARRAARAADPGRARGDAGADRPGRDRRGDAGDARGRAGRGVRGARRVPRAARLDDLPPAAGARGAGARRRADPGGQATADRRRRRGDLQRGDGRRCASSSTPPGSRSCETMAGPGRAGVRPSAEPRRDRRHRGAAPRTVWPATPIW